jgi:osmotically-inducible protein OsmY
MRVSYLALLATAMFIGCADRETRTTRTTDGPNSKTTTTTTTKESARTTTDRDLTATPSTTTETRREVTVNRPVITDPAANRDADNTVVNKRDADRELTRTPIDQNENKTDVNITAEIRKRVTGTEASINAQNVKIITQDGKVTLRGPVKNEDEKKMIERMALDVAGAGNVNNQLEVEKE